MSREEFHKYWRETHGPLVAEREDVLEIRKYEQLHVAKDGSALETAVGGNDFDGFAEVRSDSSNRN